MHPWCSPELTGAEVSAELWVEGELNGIAFALALRAMGIVHIGVQGLGGASGKPHTSHNLAGRKIYIYADPDPAGKKACQRLAMLAVERGAVPYVLPAFQDGVPEYDAAAFLAERVPCQGWKLPGKVAAAPFLAPLLYRVDMLLTRPEAS